MHVRIADRAVRIGPPPAAQSYLSIPSVVAAAKTTGLRRRPSRLRLPGREPGLRPRLRGERPRLRRAGRRRDGAHGRQGAGEGRAGGGARCPSCPGTERSTTVGGGRVASPASSATRSCSRRARAAAARACASSTTPPSSRARSRRPSAEALAAFGDGSLYVEKATRAGASCRGPGARRRAGRRAHARRARVLDPASPPEADRGVALAGAHAGDARGDGGGRGASVPRDRLPRTPARSSSCSARTATSTSSS